MSITSGTFQDVVGDAALSAALAYPSSGTLVQVIQVGAGIRTYGSASWLTGYERVGSPTAALQVPPQDARVYRIYWRS